MASLLSMVYSLDWKWTQLLIQAGRELDEYDDELDEELLEELTEDVELLLEEEEDEEDLELELLTVSPPWMRRSSKTAT